MRDGTLITTMKGEREGETKGHHSDVAEEKRRGEERQIRHKKHAKRIREGERSGKKKNKNDLPVVSGISEWAL